MEIDKPIDPGGHFPVNVTLVSGPIRYYGIEYVGYENERETIACVICRQDWPCDWLEERHPGLRAKVVEALTK